MAVEIQRPATAFALSPGKKKRPRTQAQDHLRFLRSMPCLITGLRPVEVAHIRFAAPSYGKRSVGMAEKPDDRWTVPLDPGKHREQHSMGEVEFWIKHGIDPIPVALALWGASGDDEACELILSSARPVRDRGGR